MVNRNWKRAPRQVVRIFARSLSVMIMAASPPDNSMSQDSFQTPPPKKKTVFALKFVSLQPDIASLQRDVKAERSRKRALCVAAPLQPPLRCGQLSIPKQRLFESHRHGTSHCRDVRRPSVADVCGPHHPAKRKDGN